MAEDQYKCEIQQENQPVDGHEMRHRYSFKTGKLLFLLYAGDQRQVHDGWTGERG
jgi:hypothetical protein